MVERKVGWMVEIMVEYSAEMWAGLKGWMDLRWVELMVV